MSTQTVLTVLFVLPGVKRRPATAASQAGQQALQPTPNELAAGSSVNNIMLWNVRLKQPRYRHSWLMRGTAQ